MKYLLILTSIIGGSVFAAENQTTNCNFDDQQRTIEVVYPEGGENICEVQYTKSGEMTILWTARSEKEYCQTKASALIEKQRGWGWKCDNQETDATDGQEEAAKDESGADPVESVDSVGSETK